MGPKSHKYLGFKRKKTHIISIIFCLKIWFLIEKNQSSLSPLLLPLQVFKDLNWKSEVGVLEVHEVRVWKFRVTKLRGWDLKTAKCLINLLIHRRICFRCQILRTTKTARGFSKAMIRSLEVRPWLNEEFSLLSLTCLALVRSLFLILIQFYFQFT